MSEEMDSLELRESRPGYYGIKFSEWEGLGPEGFFLQNAQIVTPSGEQYNFGAVKISWFPVRQYTAMAEESSAISGAIIGMHAKAAEEVQKHGKLTRRGFLATLGAGVAGGIAGGSVIPYSAEFISKLTELGTYDPARVIQGLAHPLNAVASFESRIISLSEAVLENEENSVYQDDTHQIYYRNVKHNLGNERLYVIKPHQDRRCSLNLMTSAALSHNPRLVTIGADLTEYACRVKAQDSYAIYGLLSDVYHAKVKGRSFKQTHTVPTAISLTIDDKPIALMSGSWTHPFAISYADRVTLNKNSLGAWWGFASKTGVWSADFFNHWSQQQLREEVEKYKPLLKEKLTAYGWTEAGTRNSVYERVLHFHNGKVSVVDDTVAWDELKGLLAEDFTALSKVSYLKPGSIFDFSDISTPGAREGGSINGMAINGLLLDSHGEFISMVSMNQDTRMNSEVFTGIVKQIDPRARYFVSGDEHGGGGIVHFNSD